MNILLCFCTIWSSIYINLSDGKRATYPIGSVSVGNNYDFYIYCPGNCDIDTVKVTYDADGWVDILGLLGDGGPNVHKPKFCGNSKRGYTSATCGMWRRRGLAKPMVRIKARFPSHNLELIVTGPNVVEINTKPTKVLTYKVGTIPESTLTKVNFHCNGDCKIYRVEVKHSKGGQVAVTGYHGNGKPRDLFCWGPSLSATTTKCDMLKTSGLSKPQIQIFGQLASYNVTLTATAIDLDRFSKLPNVKTKTLYLGNMKSPQIQYFWLDCIDDCKIKEVKVTFNSGGNVTVEGYFYGNGHQLTFCRGLSPGNKATKCVMTEKKGLSYAAIIISAKGTTDNMYLHVRNINLRNIRKLSDVQTITTKVGTLNRNQFAMYDFVCAGACHLKDVSVTYKKGGNVWADGLHDGGRFCQGNNDSTAGFQDCLKSPKNGLKNAEMVLKAKRTSEKVELTAIGVNLMEVKNKLI